ncbi:hypothetical protein HS088_TW10G00439 [Tripterygium wilfordii]|uniref:Uncharacterized protein n=1 Tax=Tripterygium wilfordii TaxID=458696 RepID=A0A7J7D530_TRIWF|nr:hypothetical protein HS088_TW10G00439 [Tripterygium wilfordii]
MGCDIEKDAILLKSGERDGAAEIDLNETRETFEIHEVTIISANNIVAKKILAFGLPGLNETRETFEICGGYHKIGKKYCGKEGSCIWTT